MIIYGLYKSPLGYITVAKSEKGFVMLDFCDCAEKGSTNNEMFTEFFDKLDRYFSGERVDLRERIDVFTNPFRLSVFKEVMKIPWGEVKTYGEIAERLSTSSRAIGVSLSKNPLLLIVPCHRVISKDGLGGYSRGLEIKRKLLEIEGINVDEIIGKIKRDPQKK
ncbi:MULTISPECIES: methylated-DNA--[protein]-cysteine S-methyltransferase [Acidianus]|uniref:Methylated-DNA--protein-cysteine methyltransferase n=1 Tax=Candidatus Acidianus copahuensis TaxID=1160895 RepID=A0A031LQQ6_9CREN|nr:MULTISPECIES: methylated-DNA--[protein]-cysteine S-methyltransferase [Acidianus]EZQ06754.1 cysteine methyltransferase [Candidatus Acidianus copahuensis]NON63262.1 methylated-DNA--[protein]-cysteine S-methyltransferase [Acidianus sp. RZ1]